MGKEMIIYRKGFDLQEGDTIRLIYGKIVIQRNETVRYQVYNQEGELLIPGEYKNVKVFKDGAIICEDETGSHNKGKNFSIYSAKGELRVSNFQSYENYFEQWMTPLRREQSIGSKSKMIKITKNNRVGVFTSSGEKILEIEFDDIQIGWEFFFVRKGRLRGVYSKNGTLILPIEYGDIQFHQGSFYATKDGASGVFSKKGKKIH